MKARIVAEISKNWTGEPGEEVSLLSNRFEQVIKINAERGYVLESWKFFQLMAKPTNMTETIIAVFVEDK